MSLSDLFYVSAYLAGAGLTLAIFIPVIAWFIPRSKDGKRRLAEGGFFASCAKYLAMGTGGILAFAIVGFLSSGIWWIFTLIKPWLTPSSLALSSLVIGVFPLVLSFSGIAIARVLGGEVDGRGAHNCKLAGINFEPLVEFLFMCHWMVIFTGGLAIWGLGASGLWVLMR